MYNYQFLSSFFNEFFKCSEELAKICKEKNINFIFISTNYVFDGKSPPYSPNASTNPVNDYGAQKVEAESKILRVLPSATILRISLQYGDHSGLSPSSKSVLDAINCENTVELDNLQIRSPTYVKNTAKVKFHFNFSKKILEFFF